MLDLKKPVRTRSGCAVEILAVLKQPLSGGDAIVAIVTSDGRRSLESYSPSGRYLWDRASTMDLVNILTTQSLQAAE